MSRRIIGMGEYQIGIGTGELVSLGLGSCVGVSLYDPTKKIAGMAHIMLPEFSDKDTVPLKTVIAHEKDEVIKLVREVISNEIEESSLIIEAKEYESLKKIIVSHEPIVGWIQHILPPMKDLVYTEEVLNTTLRSLVVLADSMTHEETNQILEKGVTDIITLPFSKQKIMNSFRFVKGYKNRKYANVALQDMIDQMIAFGAKKENLIAKIAGGAHMFQTIDDKHLMKIGERNIEASKRILKENNIPIKGEETGGNLGRTVRINIETGEFEVSTRLGVKKI